MDFNVNDWLGDWISFEHLINNHDPNLDRAWKDSTKAMRSKPLFAIMMLGDARRFWAKACKTSGKEWRFRIGGWHIEQPSAVGDDDAVAGFNLTWLDEKRTPITTHEYRLDHVLRPTPLCHGPRAFAEVRRLGSYATGPVRWSVRPKQ